MTVTVHLIAGPSGAGKTTFARWLSDELGAVHFWLDDWMERLFATDLPPFAHWTWTAERLARCEQQMVTMAIECGRRGIPSFLDLTFLQSEQRARVTQQVTRVGLASQLYVLDPGPEERWRRVSLRNVEKGETYRVHVDRATFDLIDTLWEPPTAAELEALNGAYIQTALTG